MTSTIAAQVTNNELYVFANDPHPDVTCGLNGMLAWSYLTEADYVTFVSGSTVNKVVTPANKDAGYPFWPVTSLGGNISALNIGFAKTAITKGVPSRFDYTSEQLNDASLAAVNEFCFLALYNQLATFRGLASINFSDKIQQVCIDVVNLANLAIPLTVPPATPLTNLRAAITAATTAVSTYVANHPGDPVKGVIDGMDKLSTLVPRMFMPYWSLRYYSSFATGGVASATFYDRRYSQLAVANAFDMWLSSLGTNVPADILKMISDARSNTVSGGEAPARLSKYYMANKALASSTLADINFLQTTNAQFVRRQGSVGSMSEGLAASRKRTDLALATLLLWIATLVISVAVAVFLIRQKDYPLVTALVITNITLLTIDAIGRGVSGIQPNHH